MKTKLLLLLLTFTALCMYAQDVENAAPLSVAADRPGMATGVGVLPFNGRRVSNGITQIGNTRSHYPLLCFALA